MLCYKFWLSVFKNESQLATAIALSRGALCADDDDEDVSAFKTVDVTDVAMQYAQVHNYVLLNQSE